MTFTLFIRKAIYKAYRLSRNTLFQFRDSLVTSYGHYSDPSVPLRAIPIPLSTKALSTAQQSAIANLLAHEFDFLGSGTFQPALNPSSPDTINPANRKNASRIANHLPRNYHRIDWHSDPKSGHHWQPNTWQGAITYGTAGEEILQPWTLSRMQHLPYLAKCWAASTDSSQREALLAEFQNQILDFCAANPPRWGVNWTSPMDASIRAINWLVAYDIFTAGGADFAAPFRETFFTSLLDHGHYIYQFREWHPVLRNNHYFSDLVGLIFIAAHLPQGPLAQRWLVFSAKAFLQEFFNQFHPDGSNIEASTCYHMLSSELALLGLSVLLSLPQPVRQTIQKALEPRASDTLLPQAVLERLSKIRQFTADTLSREGIALQIGDNDSGRILKLQTAFWAGPSAERSARNFLDLQRQMDTLITHFTQWNQLSNPEPQTTPLADLIRSGMEIKPQRIQTAPLPSGWATYPGLGLYLYRNERYRLSARCGPVGQFGIGGHAHNDQLSITLHIQGQPVIVDPGSYCYTSNPKARMTFRSTAYHNTLAIAGREQNNISPPEKMIFKMYDRTQATGQLENGQTFTGQHLGYGPPHTRVIQTYSDRFELQDNLDLNIEKALHFHLSPSVEIVSRSDENHWVITGPGWILDLQMEGPGRSELRSYAYSPAYGQLQDAKEIILYTHEKAAHCTLSIQTAPASNKYP